MGAADKLSSAREDESDGGSRSSPYEYRVKIIADERSLQLYKGASPMNAMSSYGNSIDTTRFLGCSATISIELIEPRSPHGVFGGFITRLDAGRVAVYHQPQGGCAAWPVNAGATFKREVRWKGILMFPLYKRAVQASMCK
jgi:hypothetical protein